MRRLAVLPLLLLPLPACAGSEPSLEDRRADYVAEAQDVCSAAKEELAALTAPATVPELSSYAEDVLEVLTSTVDDVRALAPPEEDRAELDERLFTPLEADVRAFEAYARQIGAAAEADDGAAVLRLAQERPPVSADLAFVREYGLVECADAVEQAQ